MVESEKVDWWDGDRRSRATLLCVFCIGLVFLFVVLSPTGWVGLVMGLHIGGANVCLSLHPNSRFYPGRLGTTQRRGPQLHPRVLYRILFFLLGSFVIWDSIWQFLRHRA
jgi:hypothetical protein